MRVNLYRDQSSFWEVTPFEINRWIVLVEVTFASFNTIRVAVMTYKKERVGYGHHPVDAKPLVFERSIFSFR